MVTFVFSSLDFLFCSFWFYTFVICNQLAKTSVTYNEAVNRVIFLRSSFSQVFIH